MSSKKDIDPFEWIAQSWGEVWKENFKSIHFDHFKHYKMNNLKGIELLDYACDLLLEASDVISNISPESCKCLIYLPLGYSPEIKKWNKKNWQDLGKDHEPPSLYLLKSKEDFGSSRYVEEYKRPVELVIEKDMPINALYTSSRDEHGIKFSWDFSLGIYLYRKEDF